MPFTSLPHAQNLKHDAVGGAFFFEKSTMAAASASITSSSFRATSAAHCSVGATLRDDGDAVTNSTGLPLTLTLTGASALGARRSGLGG